MEWWRLEQENDLKTVQENVLEEIKTGIENVQE